MISLDIPGFGRRELHHLVLDFNGTLALDGRVLPGVFTRLGQLEARLAIHVLTADTHGTVRLAFGHTEHAIHILPPGDERAAKAAYINELGAQSCVCVGNGANDAAMLGAAGLGVAVMQGEGLAGAALLVAHVIVPDIEIALDLLLHPTRLIATLRC